MTSPDIQPASGSQFTIVPATWRDLNHLRSLEKICFPLDEWPIFDLIGVLALPNIVRLKASIDERFVGFIAGDLHSSERLAWIATLGVLPEYRGRGIGTALLRECEARLNMPCIRLSVRASNQAGIRLYIHNGYHQIDTWPKYYRGNEDAVVMEKRVS